MGKKVTSFDYLSDIELPKFYKVRQHFDRTCIKREDIANKLEEGFLNIGLSSRIHSGMHIAVTAGSRGIANIDVITKGIVDYLKKCGANPFVVPAMGSHGGGTAKGQLEMLRGYGITEKTVGCPVISSMEVDCIGKTEDGRLVYIDREANRSDGIVVAGRIKPHTCFRGKHQSGLMKMMAIGLGKQYGAQIIHDQGFERMADNVRIFASAILKHAKVLCGVGIVENALEGTRRLLVLKPEAIEEKEPELLKEAQEHMTRILIPACDVLIVDEIGKNFSGDGMDPNVTGTFASPFASGGIKAERVCALDLSPETHGNGIGGGMASAVTRRLFDKLDLESMYVNGYTSKSLNGCKIACVLPTDREAIRFCLGSCVYANRHAPRIIRIFNSQFLEYLWISEALSKELPKDMEILSQAEALPFDTEGNLKDKEPRQRGKRRF